MQRTRGDVVDVRVDHVVTLNPLEHLGVDVHLAVGAILFTAGVHAEEAELTEGEPHAESGEYSYGQEKDKSLNESRHTHHRGDPRGTGHSLYRRNHSASGVRNASSIGPQKDWNARPVFDRGRWRHCPYGLPPLKGSGSEAISSVESERFRSKQRRFRPMTSSERRSPGVPVEETTHLPHRFHQDRACCFSLYSMAILASLIPSAALLRAQDVSGIAFSQSALTTSAYDFIEVIAEVKSPVGQNPFTDTSFTGDFEPTGSPEKVFVMGFCDSADGRLYRIRFMPSKPGAYTFHVSLKAGSATKDESGNFTATDEHRKGPIRVDPAYPWSFIWEGTGEHYFFNGTTAYWLLGWRDEQPIQYSIDRLAALKINRMRVTLAGRTSTFYGEPVMNGERWSMLIDPWPARDVHDFYHPGFDYARFNVSYWQKFDRMLRYAREKNVIISIVLGMNDEHDHPAASSDDERRYIRYAVARLGSFSNITWDLGDDLDGFRDDAWSHETGSLIEELDPYHHLATSHPVKTIHQDRSSSWFGFTSYQDWSRNQHALMLESREIQKKAGRTIPQTNEE